MAVAENSENIEFLEVDNVIYETVETTTTAQEKEVQKIPLSDIRRYKRVGVGVGLLCAVLALLNVAVPLYLHQSYMVEREQLMKNYNQVLANLTKERDELLDGNNCASPGWQTFYRGLYYISTEMKTWEDSRQWCRDQQSDLIVVNGKKEQDFVASFNKRVWLGLTDREREGSFQWVDGTPLNTPTYWYPDEPGFERDNLNAAEDCVEYYDGSLPSYPKRGWNDAQCSHHFHWICEKVVC